MRRAASGAFNGLQLDKKASAISNTLSLKRKTSINEMNERESRLETTRYMKSGQCKTQTTTCRLQTGGKMQIVDI